MVYNSRSIHENYLSQASFITTDSALLCTTDNVLYSKEHFSSQKLMIKYHNVVFLQYLTPSPLIKFST